MDEYIISLIKSIFIDLPFPVLIIQKGRIIFKNQLVDTLEKEIDEIDKIIDMVDNINNKQLNIKINGKNFLINVFKYNYYKILLFYNFHDENLYLRQVYLFSEIFNHILDGIAVLDENEKNLFVNLTFLKISGYSFSEIIGENINILSYCKGKYPEKYKEIKKSLELKKFWEGELWFESAKRKIFPVYCKFLLIENGKKYIVEIFNDLTEIKKHKEYQQYLKYYNEFLDLPNEHFLKEKLDDLISKSNKLYIILVTLVNLKQVNEIFGRKEGDYFLKGFVNRLKEIIVEYYHGNVFYLEANRFILVIKNPESSNSIENIVKSLIKFFKKNNFKLGKYEIEYKLRFGIYIIDKMEEYEKIFNKLTIADEYAKRKGKIFTIYKEKMQNEIITEYKIENLIKYALKNDRFFLLYQPKVNLKDFKVHSAEVLIRMKDENENIVSPSLFIPIAEKSDLIHEIGKWVIKKIIEDAKYINGSLKIPLKYSINISANQFIKPDFLEIFENLYKEHSELVSSFELEITEWAFMRHEEEAIKKMKKLKEMGFKLVIDDFGTGYSSLVYIKDFPIDYIKIDKIFTSEIPHNKKTVNIVESIIYLAQKLNLGITAEGVENKKQLNWFMENGIEEVQGFYFSKPLKLNDFLKLFK